ncbi:MAG: glycine betaine/L-proline ABC transporter substrate-binding protein ProX [Saezia sp.]
MQEKGISKKSIFTLIYQWLFFSGVCVLMGSNAALAQNHLPGKGITVTPIKSSIAEETFQTLLVSRALEKLGYTVKNIEIAEYAIAYQSVANGNATFMAASWVPLQNNFYNGVGGDEKLYREGVYSDAALQGYVMDKATAERYNITRIDQLKDPELAKLFDVNGDGKADLFGCTPGWGCQEAIDHQLDAYGLRDHIHHKKGSYAALMAEVLSRYKAGRPIFYYTWTPYWVSARLVLGKDVVWIQVPYSSLPGDQAGIDTAWPNGRNYGFTINTQHIVANRVFAEQNPVAAKLFSVMHLPVSDINLQNLRMSEGENQLKDIERHVDAWIKTHQSVFDGWIEEALQAGK